MGKIPFDQGLRLADILIESYLVGLGSAGWQCDPDLICFSVYAGCAMRYPIGAIIGEGLPVWIDEANFPLIEKIWGRPIEEITDTLAEAIQWSTSFYEKALPLQKKINIRV